LKDRKWLFHFETLCLSLHNCRLTKYLDSRQPTVRGTSDNMRVFSRMGVSRGDDCHPWNQRK